MPCLCIVQKFLTTSDSICSEPDDWSGLLQRVCLGGHSILLQIHHAAEQPIPTRAGSEGCGSLCRSGRRFLPLPHSEHLWLFVGGPGQYGRQCSDCGDWHLTVGHSTGRPQTQTLQPVTISCHTYQCRPYLVACALTEVMRMFHK